MKILFLALSSVFLSVAAQFLLKLGVSGSGKLDLSAALATPGTFLPAIANRWLIAGLALYVLAAVVWLFVLSRWDVSKAYPLLGLGFVATLIIGRFLGEDVSASRALGVVLIAAGTFFVARS